MMYSAEALRELEVAALLAADADFAVVDSNSETALLLAAGALRYPERLNRLQEYLESSRRTSAGRTIDYRWFARKFLQELLAYEKVIRMLLKAGAEVNRKTADGETALMRAARSGSAAGVRVLLEHGADVTVHDPSGRSVLQIAEMREDDEGQAIACAMRRALR